MDDDEETEEYGLRVIGLDLVVVRLALDLPNDADMYCA